MSDGAQRKQNETYKLSALVREQRLKGLPPFFLQFEDEAYTPIQNSYSIKVAELLHAWPRDTLDLLDRALCNLVRYSDQPGFHFAKKDRIPPFVFAEDERRGEDHFRFLSQMGFLVGELPVKPYEIAPAGFARFRELAHGTSSSENPVFVAMWYGDQSSRNEMSRLYSDAIVPAVQEAGYKVTRADLEEHNEYIMDRVLADIRRAPFMVADFTGHRNGVYFEAGFARGLGISVINCCKRTEFNDAHFDTKQLNHLRWDTPAELKDALLKRILGSIGQGPYASGGAPSP